MKRCGECGSTKIELSDIQGAGLPWRDYATVFITRSHKFHRCQNCGNFIFRAGEAKILDQLIIDSIFDQVRLFVKKILEREKCEQKELAKHLGVTPEYLSGMKQDRVPGFQTFNFLKTLAGSSHKTFEVSDPNYNVLKQAADW